MFNRQQMPVLKRFVFPHRSQTVYGNCLNTQSRDTEASPHTFPHRAWEREQGFTLIEALVAMLVLAVGLLGLAGLQARSIKNNQSAYYRSQATQLAYDIADRIRANTVEGKKFAASIYDSDVKSPSAATNQASCLTTTGCITTQMAELDLYEWNQDIKSLLPLGQGTIQGDTANTLFTISINWDDNGDGIVNNSDPKFTTRFQL